MSTARAAVAYSQLDDKGRLALAKPMREAAGLGPGSTVAAIAVGEAIMIVPQDKHLEDLLSAAARVMENANIGVSELLEGLPAARDEVVTEHYGSAFLEEMKQAAAEQVASADVY